MKNFCPECSVELEYGMTQCPCCGIDVNVSEVIEPINIPELENKELEDKNKELEDKYLRLAAEFENYKKRTSSERIEFTKTCNDSLIIELLDTLDNFERALENDSLEEGVTLIYYNFIQFLQKHGIKEINCINEVFDSNLMDGIAIIEKDGVQSGIVIDVITKGYTKDNRILRFAKVVVSK